MNIGEFIQTNVALHFILLYFLLNCICIVGWL